MKFLPSSLIMRSDNDCRGNFIELYANYFSNMEKRAENVFECKSYIKKRMKNIKLNELSSLFIVLLIVTGSYVIKTYYRIRNRDVIEERRIKHISVIQSFIYKNSKVYNGRDAVITLFSDEQIKYDKKRFYCKRKLSSGNSQIVQGKIMRLIYGPNQCLLTTYRMLCPFPAVNFDTVNFDIGASSVSERKMKFYKFDLSKPDNQPREFVSCMSRMIAFEDWALFLVQMETFRYYGGSLVVAYVECAIKKVYELMKVYEKDGLLKIRHSYKGSENPNIPYDPDAQTEYANQMTNSHMCLYEFKESAEFISFTDWDDVLVGPNFGKIPITFAESFRKLSVSYPFASSFSISRYPFVNEKAFRPKSNQFSLKQLFNQLHYSTAIVPPKVVVRPKHVAGVWIHNLIYSETEEYHEISVNSTTAALLHLKNLILNKEENEVAFNKSMYSENGSSFIDGKMLQQNMENMFKKNNFTFDPSKYSYSQIFHKLISKCYASIERSASDNSLIFCPTHKACIYPDQNIIAVKVATTFKQPKNIAGYIWHERKKFDFVENNKGCL